MLFPCLGFSWNGPPLTEMLYPAEAMEFSTYRSSARMGPDIGRVSESWIRSPSGSVEGDDSPAPAPVEASSRSSGSPGDRGMTMGPRESSALEVAPGQFVVQAARNGK